MSAGDHNSSVVTMSLDTIEDTVLPEKLAASEQYQEDKKTKDNLISGLIFGESKLTMERRLWNPRGSDLCVGGKGLEKLCLFC